MKVLVTGGLGTVGGATLSVLQARGHEVTCLEIPTKKNLSRSQRVPEVRYVWGDITSTEVVHTAIAGQAAIVHLAAILPPMSDEVPERAEAVNVEGTRNIVSAALAQEQPPKLLFSSSFDLFGPTQEQDPPRTVSDPIVATDVYTRQKIACEQMITASALSWSIYRFCDVVPMEARKPHPLMFRVPLEQRFEVVHPADLAVAIANGLEEAQIWGKIWLVGGGPSCQIRYGDYLGVGLRQAGFGVNMSFPPEAFSREAYCTDWLDSSATEALLHYQSHTFEEIMADVDKATKPKATTRLFIRLTQPFLRRWLLSLSPYYKQNKQK